MEISKYSFGTADRFGLQGKAQLAAVEKAKAKGVDLAIVWNKSHREHIIIGTDQRALLQEAEEAVEARNYTGQYLVDADHIGLDTVDLFMESSDFFTLDVVCFIGKPASSKSIAAFIDKMNPVIGRLVVPGIDDPLVIRSELLAKIAEKYLYAVQEAAKIYRYIEGKKGAGNFVTEVSMDETVEPQSPVEMLFILAALSEEHVPLQTLAPKFSGRFNKGVDCCSEYNVNVRQLLHVGYKVAAEMGTVYLGALVSNEEIVAKNVSENLYNRHIVPLFLKLHLHVFITGG